MIDVPTARSIYFLIPALVYLVPWGGDERSQLAGILLFFPPNYLYLAAPQLLWSLAVMYWKPPGLVTHGVYLGASIALFTMRVWLQCCVDRREAADGWILYWPLAAILMAACGVTAALAHTARRGG